MPDLKYMDVRLGMAIPAYPITAKPRPRQFLRCSASGEIRDVPGRAFDVRVLIRHLVLRGISENTFRAIDFVRTISRRGSVLFSLMSQYTPLGMREIPRNHRRLTGKEQRYAQNTY